MLVDFGFWRKRPAFSRQTRRNTNSKPNTGPGRAALTLAQELARTVSTCAKLTIAVTQFSTKSRRSVSGRAGCIKTARGVAEAVFSECLAPSAVAVSSFFELEKSRPQSTFFAAFLDYRQSNDGNNGPKHALCGFYLLKTSNTHNVTSGTLGSSVLTVARQLEARNEAISVLVVKKLSFFGCTPSVSGLW